MPERYAWLTFACVLCVLLLNVSLSCAADEEEHVHIKVRMPELVRKHHPKSHKLHGAHYHKPKYSVQLLSHHPSYHTTKYKKRGIKHTAYARQPPPLAPPPRRPQPLLTHNHLDMGIFGDSVLGASIGAGFHDGLGGTGLRESATMLQSSGGVGGFRNPQLFYSPSSLPQKMPDLTPNYGPAVFENIEEDEGSHHMNNEQDYDEDAATTMLTGSSQQLMQHMELMGALAAAAAAATAAAGGSGEVDEGVAGKGAIVGMRDGDDDATNKLLANDFLAKLQDTYANGGKYPTASVYRRKKKQRGGGVSGGKAVSQLGDAVETYHLNVAQQQQQQHQALLRQHYIQQEPRQSPHQQQQQSNPQHFYAANYITQQRPKPQALMYERAPAGSHSNSNNYAYYKNKYYYKHNNNNDVYATTATDASNYGYTNDTPPINEPSTDTEQEDEDEIDENAEQDNDLEDDDDTSDVGSATFFYTKNPTTTDDATPLNTLTTSFNSISDYENAATDDRRHSNNKYQLSNYNNNKNYYEVGGGNPVSYSSTTGYGGAAHVEQPMTPTTVSHLKLHRPYRQLQQKQNKYQYNILKPPMAGFAGDQLLHQLHQQRSQEQQQHQQQHFTATAQPINVIGPTASDFDEPQLQQQHKYYAQPPLGALTRYNKKRNKNRIKAKLNRNRIPTQ